MEQRIEQTAEELFFNYGLKSVSMDDIAREAGVSKKTIYQVFKDKNTIVLNIISKLLQQQQEQLKCNLKNAENAVHEILMISENVQSLVSKLRPVFVYDVNRYFPECWELMRRFKEESLKTAVESNLEKGISEGLYRRDLDFDVVTQFSLLQFSSFFSPVSYPATKFSMRSVVLQVTELFLYGIGSSKGQTVIKKYFEK